MFMDWRDALLITYSSNLSLKVCAYLLTLSLVTLFSGHLLGLLYLFVPMAVDAYGAWIIKENLPAFREDVLDNLEADCLRACGIDKSKPHFPFHETGGAISHWLLNDQKNLITFSMMAPKRDFVVIAKRTGHIFPLKSYLKVAYNTQDAGTRDIYYSDINAVDLAGNVLTMRLSSGADENYSGMGPKAAEAADLLRSRLREYKSRHQVQPD